MKMNLGETCIAQGHHLFLLNYECIPVSEDLCECPCHEHREIPMESIQDTIKTVKRSKYANFKERYYRVPVQYGNLSKRERRCYELGTIGSIPLQGEIWSFYRICDDQPGGGRFLMRHRIEWKGKYHDSYYYTSYAQLPKEIKTIIENDGSPLQSMIANDDIWSDARKAITLKDDSFFKMNPDQLVIYLNAYEDDEPNADKKDTGNIINDVILQYPWECIRFDLTRDVNKAITTPYRKVVMLKDGRRIIYSYDRWVIE